MAKGRAVHRSTCTCDDYFTLLHHLITLTSCLINFTRATRQIMNNNEMRQFLQKVPIECTLFFFYFILSIPHVVRMNFTWSHVAVQNWIPSIWETWVSCRASPVFMLCVMWIDRETCNTLSLPLSHTWHVKLKLVLCVCVCGCPSYFFIHLPLLITLATAHFGQLLCCILMTSLALAIHLHFKWHCSLCIWCSVMLP